MFTVSNPYQNYNSETIERVQHSATRLVKCRYGRHSNVSKIIHALGWPPRSQRRQDARLILFYKIAYGLAAVHFQCVLI